VRFSEADRPAITWRRRSTRAGNTLSIGARPFGVSSPKTTRDAALRRRACASRMLGSPLRCGAGAAISSCVAGPRSYKSTIVRLRSVSNAPELVRNCLRSR
jgi:hypothetical protein